MSNSVTKQNFFRHGLLYYYNGKDSIKYSSLQRYNEESDLATYFGLNVLKKVYSLIFFKFAIILNNRSNFLQLKVKRGNIIVVVLNAIAIAFFTAIPVIYALVSFNKLDTHIYTVFCVFSSFWPLMMDIIYLKYVFYRFPRGDFHNYLDTNFFVNIFLVVHALIGAIFALTWT